MCHDMGVKFKSALEIRIDASACLGIAQRRGAGQIRHIATPTLWLQQAVSDGRLVVTKVKGDINPADLGTKHVPDGVIQHAWETMGFETREGVSAKALKTIVE